MSKIKDDPIETYLEFQSWRGGTNLDGQAEEDGFDSYRGWPTHTGYSKDTMRKLLKNNPDYQHGPVTRYIPNESE